MFNNLEENIFFIILIFLIGIALYAVAFMAIPLIIAKENKLSKSKINLVILVNAIFFSEK